MRSLSGASLALIAALALESVGCSKIGELQAMKAFKAANQAYQQQDYKKASALYEEAIKSAPDTQPIAPVRKHVAAPAQTLGLSGRDLFAWPHVPVGAGI